MKNEHWSDNDVEYNLAKEKLVVELDALGTVLDDFCVRGGHNYIVTQFILDTVLNCAVVKTTRFKNAHGNPLREDNAQQALLFSEELDAAVNSMRRCIRGLIGESRPCGTK